jgi:hypothetical protein
MESEMERRERENKQILDDMCQFMNRQFRYTLKLMCISGLVLLISSITYIFFREEFNDSIQRILFGIIFASAVFFGVFLISVIIDICVRQLRCGSKKREREQLPVLSV